MADMSIAVIVGRLTRDSELKYTNSGQSVCHFSVATNSKKKKDTEWIDEANFWDVDLWGKQGESLNQYLAKGKLVAIEGTMRQDKWEQDGQPRMKIVINAHAVQLLGSNPTASQETPYSAQNDAPSSNNRPTGNHPPAQQQAGASDQTFEEFDDEIPF